MKKNTRILLSNIVAFVLASGVFQVSRLSVSAIDSVAPNISIGSWEQSAEIGTVLAIPDISLDELGDIFITLVYPNGDIVKTLEGVDIYTLPLENEEISFKADRPGRYLLLVVATDREGNTSRTNKTISIYDDVSPQLSVNAEIVGEAVVGQKVVVPKATATDKALFSTLVYVITPNDMFLLLKETDAGFIPTCAGIYRVMYIATDDSGNSSSLFYKVIVTEE